MKKAANPRTLSHAPTYKLWDDRILIFAVEISNQIFAALPFRHQPDIKTNIIRQHQTHTLYEPHSLIGFCQLDRSPQLTDCYLLEMVMKTKRIEREIENSPLAIMGNIQEKIFIR